MSPARARTAWSSSAWPTGGSCLPRAPERWPREALGPPPVRRRAGGRGQARGARRTARARAGMLARGGRAGARRGGLAGLRTRRQAHAELPLGRVGPGAGAARSGPPGAPQRGPRGGGYGAPQGAALPGRSGRPVTPGNQTALRRGVLCLFAGLFWLSRASGARGSLLVSTVGFQAPRPVAARARAGVFSCLADWKALLGEGIEQGGRVCELRR